MLQFLSRDETISFHILLLAGRYEDQYIIRFYKDKLHSMPCQNQVNFPIVRHCSIILTSIAINLQIQYYKLSIANLIHSDFLFCFRDLFWTVIPKHTNKLKNCLQVRFLRLGLVRVPRNWTVLALVKGSTFIRPKNRTVFYSPERPPFWG